METFQMNNKIEDGCYHGYYWMSNQNKPNVLNGENFTLELKNGSNPFVIEAQLYDKSKEISYSVKYFDGEYHILRHDINELKGEKNTEIDELLFESKRMDGKVLKFNRFWHEDDEEDDINGLLCDMKTLEPKEMVFVGFEN